MGARTVADELDLLRRKLQAMTDAPLSEHPDRLRKITQQHPNSITLLDSPHPIVGYTCLMHALDLVQSHEYKRIARQGEQQRNEGVFAGRGFAEWLLREELLTTTKGSVTAGDIVLYFGDPGFKHAARFLEHDRVRSKWGTGHLYEHALWEVPSPYGNDIHFFKPLSDGKSILHFKRYAEEMGVVLA
jgi:hypothetical protein